MKEAYNLDLTAIQKKKPAINKLKLLPEIEKFLSNTEFKKEFLNEHNNGCSILEDYLKVNQDGTSPPFNQIQKVLEILNTLPITVENLRNCSIGQTVNDLSKSNLSKTIKKYSQNLVQKWSRSIWEININYTDIDAENKNYLNLIMKKRKRGDEDVSDEEFQQDDNEQINTLRKIKSNDSDNFGMSDSNIYRKATIPKKALCDFTKKPISKITSSNSDNENSSGQNLRKLLENKKQKTIK